MRRNNIRTFNLIKALGAVSGLILGVSVLTACDHVNNASDQASDIASQAQDGANKASDAAGIVNNLPTSASDVRDQVTGKLQKVSITLDSETCSQSSGELRISSLGSNWPSGRYLTVAEQSPTKDGDYKPVNQSTYTALNPDPSANPQQTWAWPCGIPKDALGYLRFSIVHLDDQGKPDTATKWVYARVVA
jgi:hypothetical protein